MNLKGVILDIIQHILKKKDINSPLASLNKLSINLTDPRGNRFNTLSDTNTINNIEFSDALSSIGSTLELTATNGFPNTNSSGHKMIKITSRNILVIECLELVIEL